ncbi:helix-turn-helix domain-containing protein [Amphibacillus sp. Q70]|uniref:helix-turn-helix domain-containing protein n=1 Tax=Amphibacillus sp. Q70 TaxID=3453416 RepID=UPI003F835837
MLEIGIKIKELRKSKKMTQKTLADILNVTPQAVSKWERNESTPDIETLIKLSNYFDISIDELVGNKSKSFFDSLFSKMKGRINMDNDMNRTVEQTSQKKGTQKTIIIFDITFSFISDRGLLQTQALVAKIY